MSPRIDERLCAAVYDRHDAIDQAVDFDVDEQRILKAAVVAMAEGFADLAYEAIPDHPARFGNPPLLEFFLDGVRWHWAREVTDPECRESWSTHASAVKCPWSDIKIDLLIRRFEARVSPIWTPRAMTPAKARPSHAGTLAAAEGTVSRG